MTERGFGTKFHKVYDSDAKTYHSFSSAEHFSRSLSKKIKDLFFGRVLLDVACGTCHKTNLFSKNFEEVFALDRSPVLLEFAKERYKSNKKINYILSSASHIPLPDESVDTVAVTWGSFPLLQTLSEMQRVLRPNGTVVRIGAIDRDEFTSLFPSLDLNRLRRINNLFAKQGYTIESHDISIRFKNITEAKEVLSKVIGIQEKKIINPVYRHKVALCYYKKI